MATKSKIEWTQSTWNPVRGCTRVSEGCRFCYAERIAARFSKEGFAYEGLATMTKAGPRWLNKREACSRVTCSVEMEKTSVNFLSILE